MRKAINAPAAFTPRHFVHRAYEDQIPDYAHFASPMVHHNENWAQIDLPAHRR